MGVTSSFSTGMIAANNGLSVGQVYHALTLLPGLLPVETWGKMRLYSMDQVRQIVARAKESADNGRGRPPAIRMGQVNTQAA